MKLDIQVGCILKGTGLFVRSRSDKRSYENLHGITRAYSVNCKPLLLLEPSAGIEPATY